ncbi:MAG: phage tail sheath subtilisin-like domain-containing protein [Chloroflexota bacterium]|nr:phage tail sheath subtilisin-like domain-containing protein [Chloroflexota bacterium]
MLADQYTVPGIYRSDELLTGASEPPTGIPAFLGTAEKGPIGSPRKLTLWPEFEAEFGDPLADGFLSYAVRGFFENGGQVCYVVRLGDGARVGEPLAVRLQALQDGLTVLETLEDSDLVCVPDITQPRSQERVPLPPNLSDLRSLQRAVLDRCEQLGDRFALLDTAPGLGVEAVLGHRAGLDANNGALYYPWIRVPDGPALTQGFVPPCGHVAGVYARTDRRVGVHKAPANEVLEGVLDLETEVTAALQEPLNPEGVNCVRALPGRGIRIWGARTLSRDPAWRYVPTRRLFLTAGRWIARNMPSVALEPNGPGLWARIERELNAYFGGLFRRGALSGRTADEAFYVKCDAELNPPAVRDEGKVVSEIGLAPAVPTEYIVVRIIQGASGVVIAGPQAAG